MAEEAQKLKNIIYDAINGLLNYNSVKFIIRIIVFILISIISFVCAFITFTAFRWSLVPTQSWSQSLNLQYGLNEIPFDTVDIPNDLIATDQTYDISLILKVPNDDNNLQIGNFMITLELENSLFKDLVSSKPALINWQSSNIINSNLFNKQTISYPLTDSIILKPSTRGLRSTQYTKAHVTVGRKDWIYYPDYPRELHVYEAILRFTVQLGGISWILVNYPILSFIVFTGFSCLSIWTVAIITWCGMRVKKSKETDNRRELNNDGDKTPISVATTVTESTAPSVIDMGEASTQNINDNGQWRAYDSSEEGTIDEDNQEEEKDQEHLVKKTLRQRQIRTADDTDDTQGE